MFNKYAKTQVKYVNEYVGNACYVWKNICTKILYSIYFPFCIQNLLLMEEYSPPSRNVSNKDNVVEIRSANFMWDNNPEQPIQFEDDIKCNSSGMSM